MTLLHCIFEHILSLIPRYLFRPTTLYIRAYIVFDSQILVSAATTTTTTTILEHMLSLIPVKEYEVRGFSMKHGICHGYDINDPPVRDAQHCAERCLFKGQRRDRNNEAILKLSRCVGFVFYTNEERNCLLKWKMCDNPTPRPQSFSYYLRGKYSQHFRPTWSLAQVVQQYSTLRMHLIFFTADVYLKHV